MEISAEKTKIIASGNQESTRNDITASGRALETVNKFKDLGANVTDEGSRSEIISRIAQKAAALVKLKPVWNDKNIELCTKVRIL